MATDETQQMDEVAEDLARTRTELSQTLDELGTKLNPENIKSEARNFVRDKYDEVRRTVADFTSEHAYASLGAVAAVTATTTIVRRRRKRGFAYGRDAQIRALLAGIAVASQRAESLESQLGQVSIPSNGFASMSHRRSGPRLGMIIAALGVVTAGMLLRRRTGTQRPYAGTRSYPAQRSHAHAPLLP
jgi:hypothetical protein